MAAKPARKSYEADPLRGEGHRPETQRLGGWNSEEVVAVRVGGEREVAAERAERLRLITRRRRRSLGF